MLLPYLTSQVSPVSAKIKQHPSDFVVEENPYYLPQGAGEHCYLWIEKEGISTHDMISVLSRELKVKEKEIGVAGLKDAQAITRQWASVRLLQESAAEKFLHPQIRILKISRHANKLRIGHLKGNYFKIRLREVAASDVQRVQAAMNILEKRGVPNYFGEQRFGLNQDTHLVGKAIFEGKETRGIPRNMKYFYMSAYQSFLFNQCLAKRLENFDRLYAGDLAAKHENGAVFRVEESEKEMPRLERFEISPTGPLFGPKMMEPSGVEQEIEDSVLQEEKIDRTFFKSPFRGIEAKGARRPYRFPVRDFVMGFHDGILELSFFLPKGCYATALLRELLKAG